LTVLRSGSASDVGRVRTVNEDFALESLTLFAVADGMGGHVGGEIAARTAVDALQAGFGRRPSVEGLVSAVHDANRAVFDRGHAEPALRGMGTTMIAAALVAGEEGDRLALANVGDSRAYRFHDGELSQLTTDHSVAEELVARGELTEEEAAVHPHRHILTRVLGVGPDVSVDVWQVVPEEGDRFLLCSDGLTNEVRPDRITDVLSATRDPREAAETLVHLAVEAGGNDNVTAVVLDVVVGEQAAGTGGAAATVAAAAGGAGPGRAASAGASPVGGTVTALAGSGVSPAPGASAPRVLGSGVSAPVGDTPVRANGTGTAVLGRSAAPGPSRAASGRADHHLGIHVPRRVTVRVLLFLVVLGGLGYAGYAVVHWYVDNSYFVALDHDNIVIYQGRRGGFVGIQPKIVKRYDITTAQIPSIDLPALRGGVEEPSLEAAHNYVSGLREAVCSLAAPPAYCTTTTTTSAPASPSSTSTTTRGLGAPGAGSAPAAPRAA